MFRGMKFWDWFSLVVLVLLIVRGLIGLDADGWTGMSYLNLVLAPLALVGFLAARFMKWRQSRQADDTPMISIVMLLREPRYLDAQILRSVLHKAWGVEFEIHSDEEDEQHVDDERSYIVGQSPHFIINVPDAVYVVHNVPQPYVDDPDKVAESIRELRVRRIISEHKAWLAVDLITPLAKVPPEEAYRRIGRVIAALADEDCLGLACPQHNTVVPYDEELDERLRSEDPLYAFKDLIHPSVVGIDGDDPRMKAATEEAHRRWPEFVEAFENREGEDMFSVKAPIGEGDNVEFIWINVEAIENDVIYGKLGNEPVNNPSLHEGSRVTTRLGDLNDWIYVRQGSGEPIGGFTVAVLREQLESH